MKIFLSLDNKCLSEDKISSGILGGTERFFLLLEKMLLEIGYKVDTTIKSKSEIYDIAIHSNVKSKEVKSKKHVCWAGSFHTDASTEEYDLIIANSKHMLQSINKPGIVIPAYYDPEILDFLTDDYRERTIITTSNPNRHLVDTLKVCDELNKKEITYTWLLTGGNKLYGEHFREHFKVPDRPEINYLGVLDRPNQLQLLASSHIYCYPNLSDQSETLCVSAIEATVLGLPVIVPRKEPFLEVLPDNPYFASDINEFSEILQVLLPMNRKKSYLCDTEKYKASKIIPLLVQELTNLI